MAQLKVKFVKTDSEGRAVVQAVIPDDACRAKTWLYKQYLDDLDAMIAWCETHIDIGAWERHGTRFKFVYEDDCMCFLLRWA